jgi:hypothetical protein
MGKKRCPLLMMGALAAGGHNESGESECVEEQCMWYSPPAYEARDYGECAITEISGALFDWIRG